MQTETLFDPPLTDPDRVTDGKAHSAWKGAPDTERIAATLVTPRTGIARRRVLDAIAAAGRRGLTDYEIAAVTRLRLYTAAPRRTELRDGGWIEDSGARRATDSGSPAAVWALTPAWVAAYHSIG